MHLCTYDSHGGDDVAVDNRVHIPGPKWQGLYRYLTENPRLLEAYDYVCFPDDDLEATPAQMRRLCCDLLRYRPQMAQPSLSRHSHYSHDLTLHRPFSRGRQVNFVEIMFPCVRSDYLRQILWTFNLNSSGWGLEWLWHDIACKVYGAADFRVMDRAVFSHLRPVGSASSGGAIASPSKEMDALFAKYQMPRFEPANLNTTPLQRLFWRHYKRHWIVN